MDDDEEGAESASESDSAESEATSKSEDIEDVEEDPELRRKIEEALRISGIQGASEGSEDDDSESEEELMDDEQMMQLDEHLAEIFRSRVKEKGRGGALTCNLAIRFGCLKTASWTSWIFFCGKSLRASMLWHS